MSKQREVPVEDVLVTSVFDQTHDHAVLEADATSDDKILGSLGYKQEFKRELSIWQSFSVSFSVLCLLPSVASTLGYNLGYSGLAGAVWGWVIAALAIQTVAFSIAELCASMPTAGGLYYAGAALAPPGYGPMISWFIGWSNLFGFVTGPCSLNYALASMLITCGEIAYPSYHPQTWHIYLTMLGLLIVQSFITMQKTKFIGQFNVVGTIFNVIVVVIFIIWFPIGAKNTPKFNSNTAVWTQFTNGTDWPIGWATIMIMGFLTTIWTMSGFDAPFHLSEECSNANIASPRAIVMTAQLGMYLGWAVILVIVYTVQNIPHVVDGRYGQPFGSLCLQVLGKHAGLGMFALNIIAQFFGAQGCLITASRIIFSYARDGALPGSRYLASVDERTKTPVYATWAVAFLDALLGLLMFGGPTAIGAVFSIGAIAQYTSFTLPVALKLFNPERFRPGPWNLGIFSKPINILACCWWLLVVPALCFPAVKGKDLTLVTMNWTCLIYGGSMLLAMSWYAIAARKWFKGPRVNVKHIGGSDPGSEDAGSNEYHNGIEKSG